MIRRNFYALVAALALSAPAHAQLFRAYLASDGSDANPCTLAQPCRLLPAALAAVASGGQIWMLDSANFNTGVVSINKSVTILAIPGAVGSLVTNGAAALVLNTPGTQVALRNVVIGPVVGAGGGTGIIVSTVAELTLEGCLIANLSTHGINATGAAVVRVIDSTIRNNGQYGMRMEAGSRTTVAGSTIAQNGLAGIILSSDTPGSATTADIMSSVIDGNQYGVLAFSSHATAVVAASVTRSQLARNTESGAGAQSNAGAAVTITLSDNVIANNVEAGAASFFGGTILASGNTVTRNNYGFVNASGTFESAGNNVVRYNTSGASSGTITPIAPLL